MHTVEFLLELELFIHNFVISSEAMCLLNMHRVAIYKEEVPKKCLK